MEERFEAGTIGGWLHLPEDGNGDAILLTHGAGSDSNSALLVRLAEAFAEAGYVVLRYDLPFRHQKVKGPLTGVVSARDREGVAEAVASVKKHVKGKVFAGGHSYGGRMTAMMAAERHGMADGLVLLSYPLHPPKKPEQKRTTFFPEWKTPGLFVHGTKDPFGTIEELRESISLIPAATDVLVVEGAAHDLKRGADLAGEMLTRLRALV